ncbi:adenylyl-sulfate kinase [Alkalicoccus chagannorensis]|uniref:adenylyl-sulfate kinase n=1 Tax=Alkalicoccus chagannorensis TaxID=427072 RepID=UPI000412810B|nr:adenylyl-sulfate kinase [Alkalicoccus chagannorensis]
MNTIVLTGPICAGKSTVAAALSEQLDLPVCHMDDIRHEYYQEIGFDESKQEEIREEQGFLGVYRYWKPFEAHAVQRALADYPDHIHDFGAGHAVQDDPVSADVVATALSTAAVFFLLPSKDLREAKLVLRQRLSKQTSDPSILQLNDAFAERIQSRELADFTVYTKGKAAAETAAEITALLE